MTSGPARFLARGRCGDAAGRSSCSCDPFGVKSVVYTFAAARARPEAPRSLPVRRRLVRHPRLPRRRLGRPARIAVGWPGPRPGGTGRRHHGRRHSRPGHPVRRRGAGRPRRPAPGPGDRFRWYRDRVRAAGPGRQLRHPDPRRPALRAVDQLRRPGRQHCRLGLRAGLRGRRHDRPARLVQRRRADRRDRQRRRPRTPG